MAQINDPWSGLEEGTQMVTQTLAALGQQNRQRQIDAQNMALTNLGIQRERMVIGKEAAQERALMQMYGASTPEEAYVAQARQVQKTQSMAADQGQMKSIMDTVNQFHSLMAASPDNVEQLKGIATQVIQGMAGNFNDPKYKDAFSKMEVTPAGATTTMIVKGDEGYKHPLTGRPLDPGEWKLDIGKDEKGQPKLLRADFVKPIPPVEKPLPTNPFTTFYKGEKEKNPNITDAEISAKWEAQQAKLQGQRYPVYQAAPAGLPPGYVFNRRTGAYEWKGSGKAPGIDLGEEAATYQADKKALATLTQREQLIDTFTRRIEGNSKLFMRMRQKYGPNYNRLANIPINKLAGMMGSGDLQALNLVLRSTSNEIAKVESGSLGVAEVSQGQAEAMAKIHDVNLSINDIEKVLNTGMQLGKTSRKAITEQRSDLRSRLKSGGIEPSKEVDIPVNIQSKVTRALKEGQEFTFKYHGQMYSGRKKGNKLIFD